MSISAIPPVLPRPAWRRAWVLPLGLLAVAFLVLAPYLTRDPSAARVPVPADLPHFYPMLVAHIGFGTVALLTSVAQVWPWLRRRHPRVHRWSGRAYLFAGVLPGSLACSRWPRSVRWGSVSRPATLCSGCSG